MRRHPFSFGAILALAVFWLAANVPAPGASSDVGGTVGSVHGERMAISPSHAAVGAVSTPRKAPPSDWSTRPFLPSRSGAVHEAGTAAPFAGEASHIRVRERRTFTYDATAPPGEILNTVR